MILRKSLLVLAAGMLVGAAGCSQAATEDVVSADSNLGSEGDAALDGGQDPSLPALTEEQCRVPTVTSTAEVDADGIALGIARTSLDGCILGKPGEDGASMLARATTLFLDTAKFANLTDEDGQRVFSSFDARSPSGTLEAGLVQDVDVRINASFSPSTRLRVTRRKEADGSLTLGITNVTPVKATVFIFPVTVVETKNLSLGIRLTEAANGITVTGSGEVTLEQEKDRAEEMAQLGPRLFDWLKTELAR